MPVVELSGVTKAYESKVAVRDLSLSIDAGQMFGLLGPNGAGKNQFHSPHDDGHHHARLWQHSPICSKPFDRTSLERVGYLPEERGLYIKR